METQHLIAGTPEWHAHRATHFNASDCPAMLGCSPYTTRAQLLHKLHTGLSAEHDAATERRFADGHRFEALARPLAEKIIGDDLAPVVGTLGELSASFDGLTMMGDTAFEHKTLNAELAGLPIYGLEGVGIRAADLPKHYRAQMEQQLLVSGAERVLFMASKWDGEALVDERHCWYESDPALRAEIIAGWKQFAADLAAYTPDEVLPVVVAKAVTALPAVTVQVAGSIIVTDNFAAFQVALTDFIEHRLIREPESDQDFADLDLQIKALKGAEAALNNAETQMLAQLATVDGAKRTKDMLHKLARDNRLMAEKLLETRKDTIRANIVRKGQTDFAAHLAGLNEQLGRPYMPSIVTDFAGVVKNKRTVESLKDAVAVELARAKIAANEIAGRILKNLNFLREHATEHHFLFSDTATIVLKAEDDLQTLVKARIAEHTAAEAKRIADEREKIRAEEQAKAEKAAREKLEAEEAARIQEANRLAAADLAERVRQAAQAATPAPTPAPTAAPVATPESTYAPHVPNPPLTTANVVPMGTRAPAAPSATPTLKLGDINARLQHVSVNEAGLAALGFTATKVKGACMYSEADWGRMCDSIVAQVRMAQNHLRAA